MLKPVSPLWLDNTAAEAEKPAGAVHAVPTNGSLEQYSNSIEPSRELDGMSKRNVWAATADGVEVDIATERAVSLAAVTEACQMGRKTDARKKAIKATCILLKLAIAAFQCSV